MSDTTAVEWLGDTDPPDDPDATASCADCGALVLLRNVQLHVSWHQAQTISHQLPRQHHGAGPGGARW